MTTGVVVIAADRHEHVRRSIASLAAQRVSPARTVLVDLGSSPPLADLVGNDDVDVVELRGDACGPLPLAAARNLGAARVGTGCIVFLDADCIAAPDLVARYEQVLADHPDQLACGPVRYLRRGWKARLGERVDVEGLLACSDAPTARPAPPEGCVGVNSRHELFWSLSFGVSAATWDLLGGFDTGYVGYGAEDTDLAYRARSLNRSLAWFGGGTAFHQWHPPTRLDPARTVELVRNAHRFRQRWGRWPMEGWLHELAAAGRIDFDPAADRLALVGPSS